MDSRLEVTEQQVYGWLGRISADIDRLEWLKVLMAIKSTGLNNRKSIAEAWSRTANHRFKVSSFNKAWDSIKEGGSGIGVGTLVMMAQGKRSNVRVNIHPTGGAAPRTPHLHPTPSLRSGVDAQEDATHEKKRPEAVHIARDWGGNRIATHLRFTADDRPWSPAINPLDLPFYNSHLILEAERSNKLNAIIIVEGEKCADALHKAYFRSHGICVVGTYGTGWHPSAANLAPLIDLVIKSSIPDEDDRIEVLLWADSKDCGRDHMRKIAWCMFGLGYKWPLRIIDYMPLSQDDEDCVDWLKGPENDLGNLIERARWVTQSLPTQYQPTKEIY